MAAKEDSINVDEQERDDDSSTVGLQRTEESVHETSVVPLGTSGTTDECNISCGGEQGLVDINRGLNAAKRENEEAAPDFQSQVDIWRQEVQMLPEDTVANEPQRPGAYAEVGGRSDFRYTAARSLVLPGSGGDQEPADEERPPTDSAGINTAGLVVARYVLPENEPVLPRASQVEQASGTEPSLEEKQCKPSPKMISLVCLPLAFVVGLVILVTQINSTSEQVAASPTLSPSSPPTLSKEDHVLALFPDYTHDALAHIDSPQFQAFEWLMGDPLLETLSDWRLRQRFALASFYFATNGPTSWIKDDRWLNYSIHECQWHSSGSFSNFSGFPGSGTDQYIQVSHLNPCEEEPTALGAGGVYRHIWLRENNIEGTLPLELFWLTSLRSISLHANRLSGSISSHIGQLQDLNALSIATNALTGTLPTENGILSNVTGIFLLANQLEGTVPTELGNLQRLRELIMDSNLLTATIPTELGLLTDMYDFGLDFNLLSGNIPTELGNLKNAWFLVLNSNVLSGTIPTEFLSGLRHVRLLLLDGCDLGGAIPTEYGLLSTLEMFSLYDNNLTGSIPTEFGMLTNVNDMYIHGNNITSDIPSELGMMRNMIALTLHNNGITGLIPSELGMMRNLIMLTLHDTGLTGTIPTELGRMNNLTSLTLHNTSIIGAAAELCMIDYVGFDCSDWLRGCGCNVTSVALPNGSGTTMPGGNATH